MRMQLPLLAMFLCLVVRTMGQAPDADSGGGTLSEADLRKALADICNQVNDYYKAEHFPIPVPSPESCSFKFGTNRGYKEEDGEFKETDASHLRATVLAKSGKVVSFFNWDTSEAAHGSHAPLFDTPPPATWTETHAIEVAAKFANIFVKPWGVHLSKPEANFQWPYGDTDKTTNVIKKRAGVWIVKFGRETLTGVPFLNDGVTVFLSEEYGPDSISVAFASDYEDEHFTPLPKDKALIEARKGLDKILGWGPASSWLPGTQIQGEPEIKLMIVRPNDLLAQKSFAAAAISGQRKARLAWVGFYRVASPTNPNINGNVSVYIDAKDGSFLGGTL